MQGMIYYMGQLQLAGFPLNQACNGYAPECIFVAHTGLDFGRLHRTLRGDTFSGSSWALCNIKAWEYSIDQIRLSTQNWN